MQVVFPYKRTVGDLELRYALRSLVNVPHDGVVIAGDIPTITNDTVQTVKVPRVGCDRYMLSTANLIAAMDYVDGDFIVMHDDIFVLKPWVWKHEHRSRLADPGEAQGDYLNRIRSTAGLLRSIGVSDPLFYGLHKPNVMNKRKMLDLLAEYPMPRYKYLLRTMYHNVYAEPSEQTEDVKLKEWSGDYDGSVLSISDNVARLATFQEWINRRFPVASRYEIV